MTKLEKLAGKAGANSYVTGYKDGLKFALEVLQEYPISDATRMMREMRHEAK